MSHLRTYNVLIRDVLGASTKGRPITSGFRRKGCRIEIYVPYFTLKRAFIELRKHVERTFLRTCPFEIKFGTYKVRPVGPFQTCHGTSFSRHVLIRCIYTNVALYIYRNVVLDLQQFSWYYAYKEVLIYISVEFCGFSCV